MKAKNNVIIPALAILFALGLSGCAPEVGSEQWCANMKEKSAGNWTTNETTAYAKDCLF